MFVQAIECIELLLAGKIYLTCKMNHRYFLGKSEKIKIKDL